MYTRIRKAKTGILYGTVFLEKLIIWMKSLVLKNMYEKDILKFWNLPPERRETMILIVYDN